MLFRSFQTQLLTAVDTFLMSIITVCELNNFVLRTSIVARWLSLLTQDTNVVKSVWVRADKLNIGTQLLNCVKARNQDFERKELKVEQIFKACLIKLKEVRNSEYEEADDEEEHNDE